MTLEGALFHSSKTKKAILGCLFFKNSFHTVTEVRRLDGILFYWLSWCGWVTVFFLMKKGRERTFLAINLLMVISLSQQHITIFHEQINIAFLYVLLLAFFFLKRLTVMVLLYQMMCFMIIGMAYFLENLYLLIDPAILLLISPWMLCIPLFFICQFLAKGFRQRVSAAIIGMCLGELLYALALEPLEHRIGGPEFLDHFALTVALIAVYHSLQHALFRLKAQYTLQAQKRISK
ncbi:hypothetical protein GCM10011391_16810 [Pullulanibacillus camelliae]|uniref:Uncharacterized protein n=1 Tax=Pullulanibacillus camelliae TaxID=1707096 RepID=A0A8J2YD01_9BACL|nr:hypothetical protein [Pullulanibacillus camelliae]GGE38639.1 hypothetical protein GCM10011391_16810 [Pullulanibacillus camelliae]